MRRAIIAKNLKTKEILIFKNPSEAAKKGFDSSHIIKCCRGKRPSHRGYAWSYLFPIQSIEEVAKSDPWSLEEDNILKENFPNNNLEELLDKLPRRKFKDLILRAKSLSIHRNKKQMDVSPYDLIQELAEDILFAE